MNHPVREHTIIRTFFDVNIRPKTLVICDIDHTILTWPKTKQDFNDLYFNKTPFGLGSMFRTISEVSGLSKIINSEYAQYCANTPPIPTDFYGFRDMDETLSRSGGKIIFLTSRWRESHDYTLTQFRMLGLKDNPVIYYTNGSHDKGLFIKQHLGATVLEYNHIAFIDDLQEVLDSVISQHPHIFCYKFVRTSL